MRMSRRQFDRLVEKALEEIPEEFSELLENVAVMVEDEPSEEDLLDVGLDPAADTLLGLYQGVSLPERGSEYGAVLPDRVVVYRLPLLEMCSSRRELVQEIRDTVVHELAHYFGFVDEEELP